MANVEAEEYKAKGNEAFKAKSWDDAIKQYNKAITLDGTQPSYYSNRAACWSSKGKHESALSDASKCIELDSAFVKGYSRKGKALFDMQRYDEAEEAYNAGLKVDASNQSLSAGLAEVKANRMRASRASSSSSSSGGAGGMFGGLMDQASQMMSKMKGGGGMGGRMQMYMVAFAAYYMYKNFMGTPSKSAADDMESHEAETHETEYEELSASLPSGLRRGFSEVSGKWISYMEAQSEADSMLVFLHRTSLSAEAEFGSLLPQLLEKASAESSPKGFRILAPDRPCHGYSPCASNGEGDAKWLTALLRSQKAKRMTYIASGIEATKAVLDQVRQRKQSAQVLLLSPRASALAEAGSLKTADDVSSWLQQTSLPSALLAAEAARWAASSAEASAGTFSAAALPDGCSVTIFTAPGETEERNLLEELEQQGITVQSRQLAEGELAEQVIREALRMVQAPSDV